MRDRADVVSATFVSTSELDSCSLMLAPILSTLFLSYLDVFDEISKILNRLGESKNYCLTHSFKTILQWIQS